MKPITAYRQQKANARGRKIPFLLSFDEWWAIWRQSGKWKFRGRNKGQFQMARFGDKGGYKVGNVKIVTITDNLQEYEYSAEQCAARSRRAKGNQNGVGNRGWQKRANKLNAKLAAKIRQSTLSPRQLAENYGVSVSLIYMIRNRKVWR